MLTEEQQAVVQSRSDALGVFAFAGAGKTTTLKAYAEARPNEKILYLAFNTAIKEEAKKKFPKNVECHTTHSLAYMQEGREYRHKLNTSGNIRPDVIASVLGLDFHNPKSFRRAQQSQTILNKFILSSHNSFDDFAGQFNDGEQSSNLEDACKLWEAMIDKSNDVMPMLHDGYLKLFQLKFPSLDWDTILFDEAQDANPVTLEIIRHQDAKKVFVGDPHQQIYSFRGVVNAMHDPIVRDRLYLTETFRFGRDLADIANGILEIKREPKNYRSRHQAA